MLLNIFLEEKLQKGVAQHKFAIAEVHEKKYLCGRIRAIQSFLYLKKSNRLIPWKNSRRETAFFIVRYSVTPAVFYEKYR